MTDAHYYDKPASLTALVQMILGGTNIYTQTVNNHVVKTAAQSRSYLLTFNPVKCSRKESISTHTISTHTRHSIERLHLHIGLLIHNKTRKRDFIDIVFDKRLSVSYDLILQLETDVANSAITSFEQSGVVYLFITGNLNNIDHNP